MKRAVKVVFVAFLLAVSTGCVRTNITSQPNLSLTAREYTRVMVIGNFSDLTFRRTAEHEICVEMNAKTRTDCVPSAGVLFPGSPVNAQSIQDALARVGADALLVMGATGSGTSSFYVPRSSQTTGSATISGNMVYGQTTTTEYGGYNASKPWAGFEVALFSVVDRQPAWFASASAGGNAFSGWGDLIDAASGKTVSQLVRDGVLRAR